MGWSPPATSMMLSRRWPRPTPGPTWKPSASGPRWRMTAVMRLSSSRSTGWPESTKAKPAMPHMLGSPRAMTGSGVGPAPHPELEAEHGPEPGRAVPTPTLVIAQQPVDPGRSEDPALTRARVQEQVVSHVAELAAEPGAERHPESHLPARENVRREPGSHSPLEYVLARSALQLERARDGCDELE